MTNFTLSVLLVICKRDEVEIRTEPYWYYKEQLPSMTSTQILFFDEVHISQVSGPPVTIKLSKQNIRFLRYEEGGVGVKNGKYDTKN